MGPLLTWTWLILLISYPPNEHNEMRAGAPGWYQKNFQYVIKPPSPCKSQIKKFTQIHMESSVYLYIHNYNF